MAFETSKTTDFASRQYVADRAGIGHAVQNSLDFRFSKVLAERSDRLERIAHAGASEAALRQLGKLIEPFCRRRIKAPRNGMSCPPSKGGANRRSHN